MSRSLRHQGLGGDSAPPLVPILQPNPGVASATGLYASPGAAASPPIGRDVEQQSFHYESTISAVSAGRFASSMLSARSAFKRHPRVRRPLRGMETVLVAGVVP